MVVFCSKTPWSMLLPKGTCSSVFHSPATLSHFSSGARTAGHKGHPHGSAFKIIKQISGKIRTRFHKEMAEIEKVYGGQQTLKAPQGNEC